MVKIITNKKKLTPLIAFVSFILLSAFNISSGIAIHMHGDGATFNLDKADPVEYGAFIPAPNMYTTMSISGSNQGEFVLMDWDGTPFQTETVDYPGNDVSYAYPWYFENNLIDSTTNNDYIDPWDIQWLNVSAYGAENDTLSPYTLNTVFNYYVMAEGSELTVPLNNSIPIQIDITIDNAGPKILKLDWLLDDSEQNPLKNINFISPSGKIVDFVGPIPAMAAPSGDTIFRYTTFVADISGTYRLLLNASYTLNPGYLNLEFLDFNMRDLTVNKVSFAGDGDDWPSYQDMFDNEWGAEWFRIKGNKGDKFSLDYGYDYELSTPWVSIFSPGEYGYDADSGIVSGNYDIYFPKTGYVYISFTDTYVGSPYLASLYLKEIPAIEYNIGDNVTNIRVSRDQKKAIDFTIEQDSFVRFNYTEWGEGEALVSSMGTDNGFIFKDAKNLDGYDIFSPLETKSAGTMEFYYYYFPAGEYEAIIKNDVILYDSVLQISSDYVDFANTTIPMNILSYPDIYPSTFRTIEFTPDDYYSSLKQAQWFGINITETGQLFFNTTILASDNSAQIPTSVNPSVVVVSNVSYGEYYDYTTESHTYLQSFPAFNTTSDYLYIAYQGKWHDMHFNISSFGTDGSVDNGVDVWEGDDWYEVSRTSDTTGEFRNANGSWVLNIEDGDFAAWSKGVGSEFDLDGIDEDKYFWLRFDCDGPYTNKPYFDLISLSNITMVGDVNFALVRDSGYEYSDFWKPFPQPTSMTNSRINQESSYNSATNTYESFLHNAAPWSIGVEPGYYKLLVIPEGWSHPGNLKVQFGFSDYNGYSVETAYNITKEPLVHPWQIGDMVNVNETFLYNYTTYPFELSTTFNSTLTDWGASYLFMDCYGDAFSWTQLVVNTKNITSYDLYIMQDLPWVNNGPNGEVAYIGSSPGPNGNKTFEFGVLVDNFTLIFDFTSFEDMVSFNTDLSQYNTTVLYGSEIIASYTAPVPGLDPLVLTLMIAIPAAIGVVVVIVYVVKKRKP